jgi:hypothetical protein
MDSLDDEFGFGELFGGPGISSSQDDGGLNTMDLDFGSALRSSLEGGDMLLHQPHHPALPGEGGGGEGGHKLSPKNHRDVCVSTHAQHAR